MVWTLLFVSLVALIGVSVNTLLDKMLKFFKEAVMFLWNHLKVLPEKLEVRLDQTKTQLEETLEILKTKEPVIISMQPEPGVIEPLPKRKKVKKEEKEPFAIQGTIPLRETGGEYQIPPLSLLEDVSPQIRTLQAREEILTRSKTLETICFA